LNNSEKKKKPENKKTLKWTESLKHFLSVLLKKFCWARDVAQLVECLASVFKALHNDLQHWDKKKKVSWLLPGLWHCFSYIRKYIDDLGSC
jgi:hypothetical protein